MQIKSRKSKTLYRYLLTYAVTLLIPLAFFTHLINTSIMRALEEQTLDAVKGNLERIREQTEQKFKEMERIAISISENQSLYPYQIKKNYFRTFMGISELRSYKFGNDYIHDILYYIRGEDRIYAASQCADMAFLFKNIYYFESWSIDEIRNDLNTINAPAIIPVKKMNEKYVGMQEVIAYFYPIKPYEPYASVVFMINNKKMKELLRSTLHEYDENVLILDAQGRVITSLKDDKLPEGYLEKWDKSMSGYNIENLDDYYISRTRSENGRMTFISIVKKDNIMKIINNIKRQVYIVILSVLAIGFLVITMGIYLNYAPLHRLQQKIMARSGMDNCEKDEMLAMDMAFDKVLSMNESLNRDVEKYKLALRESLLKELVKRGGSINKEIFFEVQQSVANKSYRVIVFKLSKINAKYDKADLLKQIWKIIRRAFSEGFELYSIDNMEDKQLIAVLCFDDKSGKPEPLKNLDSILEEAHRAVCRELEIKMIIGIGNEYGEILSIGQSYAEAVRTLRYSSARKDCHIFRFDEIENDVIFENEISHYPYDILKKLSSQIKYGNFRDVKDTLEQLIGIFEKKEIPEFFSRCITYDIFNMLIKTSIEKNIELSPVIHNHIGPVLSYQGEDLAKLFDILSFICEEISRKTNVEQDENTLMKKMLDYIHNNFKDYHFSIEAMADSLDSSSSYLSQLFKEKQGKTPTEYIWKLRVDTVKKMLESSDLPIKDIVQSVGYVNISSFGRRFKKDENVTPNEYRERYRRQMQLMEKST